jgi:hypothetical protein
MRTKKEIKAKIAEIEADSRSRSIHRELSMLKWVLNEKLKVCANENCRTLFLATRSDKEYCCKECKIKQYMREHYKSKKGGGTSET